MDNLNMDPDQIKQLIGLLQQMLPQPSDEKKTEAKSKKTKKTTTITKSKKPVEEGRENKFLSMPERSMHKSDSAIDKKLNKFPPTPRSRNFSLINVVCRICGKHEEVSPKLVPESADRYKCNRCSSSEG